MSQFQSNPSIAHAISDATGARASSLASSSIALPECVPTPRKAAFEEMIRLASTLGRPEWVRKKGDGEGAGLLVPDYSVLVLATACWRPLLCEEAQEFQVETGLSVLLLRSDDHNFLGDPTTTVDVLLANSQSWLFRLRPWSRGKHDDLWLAPVQGEGKSVRFVAGLAALSPKAPFASLFEREYGFETADRRMCALPNDRGDEVHG